MRCISFFRNLALLDNGHILRNGGTKELFADPDNRQGSILTGCKNIVDARKNGENEVEVPAWGARFTSVQPVRDALKAIGIRAHSFIQKVGAFIVRYLLSNKYLCTHFPDHTSLIFI